MSAPPDPDDHSWRCLCKASLALFSANGVYSFENALNCSSPAGTPTMLGRWAYDLMKAQSSGSIDESSSLSAMLGFYIVPGSDMGRMKLISPV